MSGLRERFPAPAVMGVVNVTPDSFSDGGRFLDPGAAIDHGLRLAAQGADLLDVGGESTRPGSDRVGGVVELERVLPVVRGLCERTGVPVSVDTMKADVAEAALAAGATVVNDVTALRHDPRMGAVVAAAGAGLCLMHMRGEPRTMQDDPRYDDVAAEVAAFLGERAAHAESAGVRPELICVDPGIGFGKTAAHNLTLLRRLDEIAALGYPVLVGVSRKRFLAAATGDEGGNRLAAGIAANLEALRRGAWMVRVHDVREMRAALAVVRAVEEAL